MSLLLLGAGLGLPGVAAQIWPYPFALTADVVGWGSSTMNGTDALGPMNSVASLTTGETFYGAAASVPDSGGIACVNRGNGGETNVQVSARMVAASARLKAANAILQFIGNYNSGADPVGDHIASAQTAVGPTGLNHSRFLHVPKHNDRGSDGGGFLWARYRDAVTRLTALYPGRVQDTSMILRTMAPLDGTDAADKLADTAMLSYSSDDSHLNATGYAYLAQHGYAPWVESKEAGGLPFVPWQRVYSTASTNQTNGGLVANLQWDSAGASITGKTFTIIGANAADFSVVVNGANLELRRASATVLLDAPLYLTLRISDGVKQRDIQLAVYLMDLTGTRRGRPRLQGHHLAANTGMMSGLRGVTGSKLSFAIGLKVNAGSGTDRGLISFGGASTPKGLWFYLKTSDVIACGARDLVDLTLTINQDSSTTTAQKFTAANGVMWLFGNFDLDAGTGSLRVNEFAATTSSPLTGRDYCVADQTNDTTMHVMFGTSPGVRTHSDTEIEAMCFWNDAIDWSVSGNRARVYDVATKATRLHETVGADGPGVVDGVSPFLWLQGCAANIMGGLNLATGERFIDGHDPLPMATLV